MAEELIEIPTEEAPTLEEKVKTFGEGDPALEALEVDPEEERTARDIVAVEQEITKFPDEIPVDNLSFPKEIPEPETDKISKKKSKLESVRPEEVTGLVLDSTIVTEKDSSKVSKTILDGSFPPEIPEGLEPSAPEGVMVAGDPSLLTERQREYLRGTPDEPFFKSEPPPIDPSAFPAEIEEIPTEPVRKNHGALVSALAPLGADENTIVKTIRWSLGFNKKKPLHFYDETYTELLDDLGLNTKNASVRGLGLSMSMILAPFNLLTGGVSAIGKSTKLRGVVTNAENVALTALSNAENAISRSTGIARFNTKVKLGKKAFNDPTNKIGISNAIDVEKASIIADARRVIEESKGILTKRLNIGLTSKGKKIFNFELNKRVKATVVEMKASGKDVTDIKTNRIIKREVDLLEQDFIDVAKASDFKAGGIEGGRGALTPKQTLLNRRIFDTGGIKYAGLSLIDSRQMAGIVIKSGLPKYFNMAAESKWALVSTGPRFLKGMRKFLRTAFVTDKPTSRAARDLDVMFSRAQVDLEDARDLFRAENEAFFKDLNKAEVKEFDTILTKAVNINISAKKQADTLDEAFSFIHNNASPAVNKKIGEWLQINKKMAKEAGVSESDILEFYYPWVFRKRGEKFTARIPKEISPAQREFLIQKRGTGVDTEGYTRLKNPIETFTIRKTSIHAANIQDKMFTTIAGKFGKKFDNVVDADRAGYRILIDKPQEINQAILKDIDLKQYTDVYIPKDIASDLEKLGAAYKLPIGFHEFGLVTKVWKTAVTTMFPSFHVRNYISNVVLNAADMGLHAIDPKLNSIADLVIRGKDKGVDINLFYKTELGETVTIGQLRKEVDDLKVINGFYIDELGLKANAKGAKGAMWKRMLMAGNPASQEFLPVKWGRNLGQHIENQSRVTNYVYWRMRGIKPRMAARMAIKTLFDYSDLTKGEKWMQLAFPFYTFTRKNTEAQMRLLMRKPGFIAKQMKLFREVGPDTWDWEFMPPWLKNQSVVKAFGTLWGHGMFPVSDMADIVISQGKSLNKLMNPMFKYALENPHFGLGRSMFDGRPINNIRKADEFRYLWNQHRKGTIGATEAAAWLGLGETAEGKIEGDPNKLLILRSGLTSRFQSTWGQLNKEDTDMAKKILRSVYGVSAISVDPDTRKYFAITKARNDSLNELVGLGLARGETVLFRARKSEYTRGGAKKVNAAISKMNEDVRDGVIDSIEDMNERTKQIKELAVSLTLKEFAKDPSFEDD